MVTSPLDPVTLDLSGDRIHATYRLHGPPARTTAILEQLVVEQTIEFPPELVPDDDIRRHIIGRVEDLRDVSDDVVEAKVSYAEEIAGDQFPQLINVLFGNISLVPGVRLVDLHLPDRLLSVFPGPQLGIAGLRERLEASDGPLLATALKPMGTPITRLGEIAYDLAVNGIHLVKDDHSFATQPFASFRERVPQLADAVRRASDDRTDGQALYLPALNLPSEDLDAGIELAVAAGAGGLLLLPGLVGHDAMRRIAAQAPDGFVIMAHPSFLGGFVTDPTSGLDDGLLLGTLARLAGADISIFPNHSGRFTFSPEVCSRIAEACRRDLGDLAPCFPAPGGGMSVERVPEMVRFFGEDVCLLIGGDLYRGDVPTQVRRMVSALEEV